jgi:hypothetical protein
MYIWKRNYILTMIRSFILLFVLLFFTSGFINQGDSDLVKNNYWHIAGPAKESQETINEIRKNEGIVRVTAQNSPEKEIELNVMITPSESNAGIITNLPSQSKLVSITYKSTQLIKLQAREGNKEGTDCIHGGSHPRVDLPASANQFTTIKIPWRDFKQDGLPNGKLLNIHNLCKFNFVNYNPISGFVLEIKSVTFQD